MQRFSMKLNIKIHHTSFTQQHIIHLIHFNFSSEYKKNFRFLSEVPSATRLFRSITRLKLDYILCIRTFLNSLRILYWGIKHFYLYQIVTGLILCFFISLILCFFFNSIFVLTHFRFLQMMSFSLIHTSTFTILSLFSFFLNSIKAFQISLDIVFSDSDMYIDYYVSLFHLVFLSLFPVFYLFFLVSVFLFEVSVFQHVVSLYRPKVVVFLFWLNLVEHHWNYIDWLLVNDKLRSISATWTNVLHMNPVDWSFYFMVFNTTYNNTCISFLSWQSVLLVKETRVPGEI